MWENKGGPCRRACAARVKGTAMQSYSCASACAAHGACKVAVEASAHCEGWPRPVSCGLRALALSRLRRCVLLSPTALRQTLLMICGLLLLMLSRRWRPGSASTNPHTQVCLRHRRLCPMHVARPKLRRRDEGAQAVCLPVGVSGFSFVGKASVFVHLLVVRGGMCA